MADAQLTYYIFEGTLTGYAGKQTFHMSALSGGGGGTTKGGQTSAVNNPYMEALVTSGKGKGHVHGGPIPPGRYIIHKPGKHPHLGLSARLEHPKWRPFGRDGFFIHGRGPHGSDGCIVPLDGTQFKNLMAALTSSGGGILHVQEAMDDVRFA